ncbi:hypothetical protein EPN90_03845 [Patescibacteria group bacterium]|nr:MAG: hypothetical protein EPN90_03845 [Patescibacteria group bacterium]
MSVRPIINGTVASAGLIGVYFGLVTLISGSQFAVSQFGRYWYFFVPLSLGFGIQIALYSYFRRSIDARDGGKKVLAATGTTSTFAMVSCCSHYLANVLPLLALGGIFSIIGQLQVQFFWVGLAANALGIAYLVRKILLVRAAAL